MRRRTGFTLVELVVVVMIIGILVAIAAPKMLNIMGDATDNGVRQSLSVIRDAIENYAAQNDGAYPPGTDETAFKDALKDYLRGVFPKSLVGTKTADVTIINDNNPLTADGLTGWMYNGTTSEFIINCTDTSEDGTTTYNQF